MEFTDDTLFNICGYLNLKDMLAFGCSSRNTSIVFENILWWLDKIPKKSVKYSLPKNPLWNAAKYNKEKHVGVLLQKFHWRQYVLRYSAAEAAENGNLNMLQLFLRQGLLCTCNAMAKAITYGHLEIVKVLIYSKGCEFNCIPFMESYCRTAIIHHRTEIFKLLVQYNMYDYNINLWEFIIKCDNLEAAIYLLENANDYNINEISKIAIEYQNIPFINVLIGYGISDNEILKIPIVKGYVDIVEILLDVGLIYKDALRDAVNHQHVEIIKMLIRKGVNTTNMMNLAVRNGNIKVVKALIEEDVGVSDQALQCALNGTNIEIFKLLLDSGFRTNNLITKILRSIHNSELSKLDMITYVFQKGYQDDTNDILYMAMELNHFEIVKFLLHKGYRNDIILPMAAEKGNFEIVDFMIKEKPFDKKMLFESFDKAIKNGHTEVAQFLIRM